MPLIFLWSCPYPTANRCDLSFKSSHAQHLLNPSVCTYLSTAEAASNPDPVSMHL